MTNFTIHIDKYIETRSSQNLSLRTIEAYQSDLYDFNRFLATETFDNEIIVRYIKHLKVNRKLKDTSIKRKLIVLKMFLAYLKEKNIINDNNYPAAFFRYKQEKRLPKTLETDEVVKVLNVLSNKAFVTQGENSWLAIRNLALIDMLISTGIRISEASNIDVSDISLSDRTILIHGKGKKQRLLYISCKDTWMNVTNWIEKRKKLNPLTDKLFINRYKSQLGIHGIEYIFKGIKEECHVNPKATPHYFRHTFASNLLSRGADLRSVQELLGHSSVQTTEIYTEVSVKRKQEVLDNYNYRNDL